MILAENSLILIGGLVAGAACALVAIAPAIVARGGHFAALSMFQWLLAILVAGLAAIFLATRLMLRLPLIPALRSE